MRESPSSWLNLLEAKLPPKNDPKYKSVLEYVLGSIQRGQKIVELIEEHSSHLKNKKILDVGCGGGGVAIAFAKVGCLVTAIDADRDNIAMAKLRAKEENVNLNVLQCNAETFNLQETNFDGALLIDFLEYTLKSELVLKQLSALIKPGGFCYIAVLNRLYWFNKTIRHPHHKHFYFYGELYRLLKRNHFNPVFLDPKPWRHPFRSYWKILAIKKM